MPELRPLVNLFTPEGLLAEPILARVEMASATRDSEANPHLAPCPRREILQGAQARLAGVPDIFTELGSNRVSGTPQLAISPLLAQMGGPAVRQNLGYAILAALADPGERLNAFALAHWIARPALGQGFAPQESSYINLAAVGRSGPIVRAALGPWLTGVAPVSDPATFAGI